MLKSSLMSFLTLQINLFYGLILHDNEEIPCKPLKILLFDLLNIEITGLEFYQIKRKWLFIGTYKPPVVNDLNLLINLTKFLIISLGNMKTYL